MTTYHDAVAALPENAAVDKVALRNLLTARMPYVLADSDIAGDLTGVDPDTGAAIVDIVFIGRLFHFDAADTTTLDDGVSCLVTADGRRYKLADGADVVAYSVLDNAL